MDEEQIPATTLMNNNHLLRLLMNDPTVKVLRLRGNHRPVLLVENPRIELQPCEWAEWEVYSYAISRNTHIKELLLVHSPDNQRPFAQSGFAFFLMGVNINRSITRLHLDNIHMTWRTVFGETLKEAISKRITHLSITNCNLTSDAIVQFCRTINERKTKLNSIKLSNVNLTANSIKLIVGAINNNRDLQLKDFDISSNAHTLGKEGILECRPLLTNQHSRLERLHLDETLFDDELTISISDCLRKNKCLKELQLKPPSDSFTSKVTARGEDAILKMLYDTSSVMNTWSSNHTLSLFGGRRSTSTKISSLLACNLGGTRQAKCYKIAMAHFINTQTGTAFPITEEDNKVIPQMLARFAQNNDEHNIYHTACYNSIRQLAGIIFENSWYANHSGRVVEVDKIIFTASRNPNLDVNIGALQSLLAEAIKKSGCK